MTDQNEHNSDDGSSEQPDQLRVENPEGVAVNKDGKTKINVARRNFLSGTAQAVVGGTLLAAGATTWNAIKDASQLPEWTGFRQPRLEIERYGFNQDSPINWIMGSYVENMTISAGSNNVRNKLLRNSEAGKIAQERSKATADVAETVAKMLERRSVEEINDDIEIERERASISIGSAIASKAFRAILGWETKHNQAQTEYWFNSKVDIARPNSPGIFHDLSSIRLQLGERGAHQGVVHWPMVGRVQDLYTPRRELEIDTTNQLLMLTYIADTGLGNPHLNIAGKNASGTWASLYLCSPYLFSGSNHATLADRLRVWISKQKRAGNSFQVTFVFDEEAYRAWDFGEQVFPQNLLKVGVAVLETDVAQGLNALGNVPPKPDDGVLRHDQPKVN